MNAFAEKATRKSGYIGLFGRPNAGKSSLLNALIGQKVSIASPKQQTTRDRVLGILNRGDAQMVFVDTPGYFGDAYKNELDKHLLSQFRKALSDVDISLLLLDAKKISADKSVLDELKSTMLLLSKNSGLVVALNKIDLLSKEDLLPLLESLSQRISDFGIDEFEVFPVSAKTKSGLEPLLYNLENALPGQEHFFPEDVYTDSSGESRVEETDSRKSIFVLKSRVAL